MRTIYKNLLKSCPCNGCYSWDTCYLRKMPLCHYPENVQNFIISMPYAFISYQERAMVFDEIGLILASDYLEAVGKVFSMLKTLNKINNNFSGRCFGY